MTEKKIGIYKEYGKPPIEQTGKHLTGKDPTTKSYRLAL
jgi:hypothetical protein